MGARVIATTHTGPTISRHPRRKTSCFIHQPGACLHYTRLHAARVYVRQSPGSASEAGAAVGGIPLGRRPPRALSLEILTLGMSDR